MNRFQTFFSRSLTNSAVSLHKQVPKNLKGKSKSSQEWLTRQLNDPYVEKAKIMNYRCRSAFKLLEIDEKYKILKPGDVVLDCGAAPGSWSQIAAHRSNADANREEKPKGQVVSIDLLHFAPIPGVKVFGGMDFSKNESQEKLKEALGGRPVNCVLSDMAPNSTGVRVLDQEQITNLCYSVLRFAILMSTEGAHLVVKFWDNAEIQNLEKDMLKFYDNVRRIKPKSSRSDSAECFLLARNFKGLLK
ncbi:FTSJ2 family protein [Megaselia abdita]